MSRHPAQDLQISVTPRRGLQLSRRTFLRTLMVFAVTSTVVRSMNGFSNDAIMSELYSEMKNCQSLVSFQMFQRACNLVKWRQVQHLAQGKLEKGGGTILFDILNEKVEGMLGPNSYDSISGKVRRTEVIFVGRWIVFMIALEDIAEKSKDLESDLDNYNNWVRTLTELKDLKNLRAKFENPLLSLEEKVDALIQELKLALPDSGISAEAKAAVKSWFPTDEVFRERCKNLCEDLTCCLRDDTQLNLENLEAELSGYRNNGLQRFQSLMNGTLCPRERVNEVCELFWTSNATEFGGLTRKAVEDALGCWFVPQEWTNIIRNLNVQGKNATLDLRKLCAKLRKIGFSGGDEPIKSALESLEKKLDVDAPVPCADAIQKFRELLSTTISVTVKEAENAKPIFEEATLRAVNAAP